MGHSVAGLAAACVGIVLFGTNYIPVRKYEMHDGAMFQWMMCNGLLGVGILSQLAFGGEVIGYGLLGGAILAAQNFLVLPVVKLLGLGVGFALYHIINLCVGYAVGRFGLFGAPVDEASNPPLRDASVLVLIASFAFMLRVEPDMRHGGAATPSAERAEGGGLGAVDEASTAIAPLGHVELSVVSPRCASTSATRWTEQRRGEPSDARDSPERGVSSPSPRFVSSAHSPVALARAPQPRDAAATADGDDDDRHARKPTWLNTMPAAVREGSERLATGAPASDAPVDADAAAARARWAARRRHALGVGIALLAGSTCGVNAVPFDIWTHSVRARGVSPLTFVFSQSLGAYAAATTFYLVYGLCALARRVPVQHSPVRPAYLAGCMWGTGLSAQFVAIEELGMAEAYVICAIGPVMVSALISCVVFGEIRGRANVRDFAIALTLQCAGVVMLALGS
ncbi:hypothetical protein KFE25_009558 [Diacronema lutheri]|uniref:Uncharacterized protein n=1 Tax=Diacronema lutheri TaxID=2081491 RepID=A0A8J5XZ31_DIALT|nr:hypothetical protein KFE25_009558 [Diacronema lutheri]